MGEWAWSIVMAARRRARRRSAREAVIPYARGFKPPSTEKSISAITKSSSSSSLHPHYRPGDGFFRPIPPPSSVDDWLAQYREPGQTYQQFLDDCPWLSRRRWKQSKQAFNPDGGNIREKYPEGAIYLLPLGEFDTVSPTSCAPGFSSLVEYVSLFYGLSVKVMDGLQLECNKGNIQLVQTSKEGSGESDRMNGQSLQRFTSLRPRSHTIECRHHLSTGHMQLQVSSILTTLKRYVPKDALFVMALTMHDLYDETPDLFVAGMAAGSHRVGVFSFFRYDPTLSFSEEFWYDIHKSKTVALDIRKRLVLQHSCKLVVHEMAHLLGVDHCIFYECCMNGSGHLTEDFRQPMFLCPVDLHKLQTLCGFDVIERYRKMAVFFEKHGIKEVEWIRERLRYIQEQAAT